MRGKRTPSSREEEPGPKPLRCAIYTRQSVEENPPQEFNTLQAQREAAEAFVRSQLHAGWTVLPERYDDGGFTGANLDRPALRRLLADIEAGGIDCALVYKVDRLSRSLLDFARLMEVFERHQVNLVSITQPLNTTSSLGRLTLNILLSFAEFERSMIRDRTRDKMSAARCRGRWVGGTPVLGYDIADTGGKLIVNPEEAHRVNQIFALYLERRTFEATLAEIQKRGWKTKRWRTRSGNERLGRPFTGPVLQRLLQNVLYVGQVLHRDQRYAGEQEAIVDLDVWQRANETLARGQNAKRRSSSRATKKTAVRRASPAPAGNRSERVPRIARLLALARKFEELVGCGAVHNYAAMAQIGQVSRSRVTQMTSLLNLAPDIQEEILFLRPEVAKRVRISEPSLRKLTATLLWSKQREQWRSLCHAAQSPGLKISMAMARSDVDS